MHPSLIHPVFSQLGQACLDRLDFMRPPAGPRLWLGPLPADLLVIQGAGWVHGDPAKEAMPSPPKSGYSVVIDIGSWQSKGLDKDWFSSVNQILTDGGVYLFGCLGPSSLRDLRRTLDQTGLSAQGLLPEAMIASLADMHDLGDALQQAGLVSPVMESDPLRFSYQTARQLVRDLRVWPYRKTWQALDRAKIGSGIGAKALGLAFEALSKTQSGGLIIDWEMVVGHAWKPEPVLRAESKAEASGFSPLKFFRKKP